jgi:hypothetical protein
MELQTEPMEDSGLSSKVQEAEEPGTEPARLAVVSDGVVTRREQAPRPARYEPPAVPAKPVPVWDRVPLRDAGKYVGEKLRVVTTDGTVLEGRLVGEDVNELRFERRITAGTMAVHVARSEVLSLHKSRKRRRS